MGSGGNNLEDIIPKNMNFSQLDMVRIFLSPISIYCTHLSDKSEHYLLTLKALRRQKGFCSPKDQHKHAEHF